MKMLLSYAQSILGRARMLLEMDILFAPKGEKNKALWVFLWIAYSIATALLISNHAPWHDEAYVWLIAREVSWLNIYREVGAQHAPSLWYYMLAVLVKMGFPYWTMQVLHWLGACFAAGIFLFWSPFTTLLKTLFIFSFYIAYEHAVTARVYMLTLLLMWSACGCYAKRYQRPIIYGFVIALLAHTSFFGLLVAMFLWAEFFFLREGTLTYRQWGAMVIMALSILLSLNGLIFDKYASPYYNNFIRFFHTEGMGDMFSFAYLSPNAEYFFSDGIKAVLRFIAPWLGALYGVLTLWLLNRWRAFGLMAFLLSSWFFILYLMIFNYSWPAPRHYSFYLMYTVMVLWLYKVRYQATRTMVESLIGILLIVAFLLGVLGTVAQGDRDSRLPFSGTKRMANYLIEHKLGNKVFVVNDVIPVFGILPYMPKAALWDPRTKKVARYMHFDHLSIKQPTMRSIVSLMETNPISSDPIYLISVSRASQKFDGRLKLLYFADGQNDALWLYLLTGSGKNRGAN